MPSAHLKNSAPTKKVILIVDDEVVLREILVDLLRSDEVTVIEASGGDAAREVIRGRRVDVVITDAQMPDGDGFDLIRFLKAGSDAVRRPVFIMFTGFADMTDAQAYELGIDAVFAKPCDLVALRTAVLGYLR